MSAIFSSIAQYSFKKILWLPAKILGSMCYPWYVVLAHKTPNKMISWFLCTVSVQRKEMNFLTCCAGKRPVGISPLSHNTWTKEKHCSILYKSSRELNRKPLNWTPVRVRAWIGFRLLEIRLISLIKLFEFGFFF